MTLTLYDTVAYETRDNVWSPSTFKTKIALNYKGIPYKTVFIEFKEIEETLKKLGAAPTGKKPDGTDYYTVPALHDSDTGKIITESSTIVEYLDAKYPAKPQLFPPGSKSAIALYDNIIFTEFVLPILPAALVSLADHIPPSSRDHYIATREAMLGAKFETFSPEGEVRNKQYGAAKDGLTKIAGFLDKNGEGSIHLYGDKFTFGDAIAAGWLTFAKATSPPGVWDVVSTWDGGRWAKLVDSVEKYAYPQ